MATLPDHPKPVKGAASYVAHGNDVFMVCTEGFPSVVMTRNNSQQAMISARAFQRKENKAVTREENRLKKLAEKGLTLPRIAVY